MPQVESIEPIQSTSEEHMMSDMNHKLLIGTPVVYGTSPSSMIFCH